MNRILIWYAGLEGRKKALLVALVGAVVVAAVFIIAFLLVVPKKVEVRYGTIVRDPIDGRVWSDNTKTALVSPDEAKNYKIEYVDKYSPEHEKQLEEERAAREAKETQAQTETGFLGIAFPAGEEQLKSMENVRKSIESAGESVVTGMQIASEISSTKSTLVKTRNEIAAIPAPAQLQGLKNEVLAVFDMYIRACDLFLEGIANADVTKIQEAENLTREATAKMQRVLGSLSGGAP